MKLKKSLLSLSLVAAMAVSSVSAFAAKNPPAPGAPINGTPNSTSTAPATVRPLVAGVSTKADVLEAIAQVRYLYDNTFYFEARRGLDQILTAIPGTAAGSSSAVPVAPFWGMLTLKEQGEVRILSEAIDNGIDRCILDEAFADVARYMATGYYAEANEVLVKDVFSLLGFAGLTTSDLTGATSGGQELLYNAGRVFTIDDWNLARALDAQISGVIGLIIHSKAEAEAYVRHYYNLPDWVDLWTAQVGSRFDVYASYSLSNGTVVQLGEVDIDEFGVVLLTTIPYASVDGTPGEYENPF